MKLNTVLLSLELTSSVSFLKFHSHLQIVLFFVDNSWGQQNEDWDSLIKTPAINFTFESALKKASPASLETHYNQLRKQTNNSSNPTLQNNLLWKLVKLAESYLRRAYHAGNSSSERYNSSNINEILENDIVFKMLQYYRKLATEKNNSRHGIITTSQRKFTSFWNASLQQFRQWWNKTKVPDLRVGKRIEKVKQIGAKLMAYFSHSHSKNTSTPSRPTDDQERVTFRNRRLLYITKTTKRTYQYLDTKYVKNVRKIGWQEPERWLRFVNDYRKKKARKASEALAANISTTPLFMFQKLKKNLVFQERQEKLARKEPLF